MKTKSVRKALGRFGFMVDGKTTTFWTRNDKFWNRRIEVVDQGGNAFCLPIVIERDGSEYVSFHAKTIKSLVDFLEGAA